MGRAEDLHGAARADDGGARGEADAGEDVLAGGRGEEQDPRRHRGGVHAAAAVPPRHEEVHAGRQQGQGERSRGSAEARSAIQ